MSPGPAGFGTVSFSIKIPPKGAPAPAAVKKKLRLPKVIPGNTASIGVSVNGSAPLNFACAGPTCSGTFQAPAGQSDTIAIQALDSFSNILAAGSTSQVINPDGVNAVSVKLALWATNFSIDTNPPGLSSAASGTAAFSVTAFQGDSVINGAVGNPITLSINDATGTVSLTNPTLSSTTQAATLAYTFSPATAQSENWLTITGTAAGNAPTTMLYEIGRTFYTFTSTGIVGFTPGASSPTRTVAIPGGFTDVRSMACDGTNLYIADFGTGASHGLTPTATSAVTYNADDAVPQGIAATGLGGSATLYMGSFFASIGVDGLTGSAGNPIPLPPNVVTFSSAVNPTPQQAVVLDPLGNLFSASGGSGVSTGGFTEYGAINPGVTPSHAGSIVRTGSANTNSNMIAIDTGTNPTTVYTSDTNGGGAGVLEEYDTATPAPTKTSADNANFQVYVDPAGRVYTGSSPGLLDVYARQNINGAMLYQLAASSVVFDSAGYTFAFQGGNITVYAPGSQSAVYFMFGSYGTANAGPGVLGALCQ